MPGKTAHAVDRDRLADLLARCGALPSAPDASADRTVPAAREWLRRWAPRTMAAPAPACSCAAGRCAVCN